MAASDTSGSPSPETRRDMRWASLAGFVLMFAASRGVTGTFPVTIAGDSGEGSLRWALEQANAVSGLDTVAFLMSGAAPHTIQPTSPFPIITDEVVIDGWTQPGFSGVPIVELDGSLAGVGVHGSGIKATTTFLIVRGLIINRFAEHGIRIDGCQESVVEGCFVGTDITGALALGNGADGIAATNCTASTIGGELPTSRNVISGNTWSGIGLNYGCSAIRIVGNYIGVDASGSSDLGNLRHGVYIGDDASGNWVGGLSEAERNVISGNQQKGIYIEDLASGNTVAGNLVGTDVSGAIGIGNSEQGILIDGEATENRIGGTSAAERNTVSSSGLTGIHITGDASVNTVTGNFIGTDISGSIALGNGYDGVLLGGYCHDNTVGGSGMAFGNVIASSVRSGVALGSHSTNNRIVGNLIGTDVTGTIPLGNAMRGIWIGGWSSNNTIGGVAPGEGNTIVANAMEGIDIEDEATLNLIIGNRIGTNVSGLEGIGNHGCGVLIQGSASLNTIGQIGQDGANTIAHNIESGVRVTGGSGNSIRANSIHSNGELGIDIGPAGVTENDDGDPDVGPNGLQNFPILTSIVIDGASTTVAGTLNSSPNHTFYLDFYFSSECDPSLHGEGETFLGSFIVTTGGSGEVSFSCTYDMAIPPGSFVSATATDQRGSTSEFGQTEFAVPVSLSAFNATALAEGILLEWTTESETANLGFVLYRSQSAVNDYTRITNELIRGAGTSAIRHHYSYLDATAAHDSSYSYRLTAVDTAGIESLCGVTTAAALPEVCTLPSWRPNPFSNQAVVELSLRQMDNVEVKVANAQGRIVRIIHDGELLPGAYSFLWDSKDSAGCPVPCGLYIGIVRVGRAQHTTPIMHVR